MGRFHLDRLGGFEENSKFGEIIRHDHHVVCWPLPLESHKCFCDAMRILENARKMNVWQTTRPQVQKCAGHVL
eukprot:6480102-Amphidinium_carterae.2